MKKGFVYLIQDQESLRVKVGFSMHPEKRFKQIACGYPVELKLVKYVKGSDAHEYAFHYRLRDHRSHIGNQREWYDLTSESIDILNLLFTKGVSDNYVMWAEKRRQARRRKYEERHAARVHKKINKWKKRHNVEMPEWLSLCAKTMKFNEMSMREIVTKSYKHSEFVSAFLNIYNQGQKQLLTESQVTYCIGIMKAFSELVSDDGKANPASSIKDLASKGCLVCGDGRRYGQCKCGMVVSRKSINLAIYEAMPSTYIQRKGNGSTLLSQRALAMCLNIKKIYDEEIKSAEVAA